LQIGKDKDSTARHFMAFGDRLKALREKAGMSQEAIARAAGISTSAISKLEQKKVEPTWPTVQALARALGVGCQTFDDEAVSPAEPTPAKKTPARGAAKKKGK
jgi:transcriptional regulator with XRE-family HTH domain